MKKVIVTGSGGLIGSEAVRHFTALGHEVVGIENDTRARLFGPEASTERVTRSLEEECDGFRREPLDIREREGVESLFARNAGEVELIVHAAAQPSHDWAATDPHADFGINALGTLTLLEATRNSCPDASFVFLSTNKVYGDLPNRLPLEDRRMRLELPEDHPWYGGIGTDMSIDRSTHSLFGVSKAAADLAVQEYGRYFDIPTVCFRGGCLTGPQHAGARLHGFLAYLMMCTVTGSEYTVYGYEGKQVRDNIHSHDVVRAIEAFHRSPRTGAVYNLGGGRDNSISMLEAISACERVAGRSLNHSFSDEARIGDHRWWISDLAEFRRDYPEWDLEIGLGEILTDIHDANADRWLTTT